MEWDKLISVYGPLALGWPVALYLLKYVLDNYRTDTQAHIDATVKLALTLQALTDAIRERKP